METMILVKRLAKIVVIVKALNLVILVSGEELNVRLRKEVDNAMLRNLWELNLEKWK